jgi:polyphosphate glucokinase
MDEESVEGEGTAEPESAGETAGADDAPSQRSMPTAGDEGPTGNGAKPVGPASGNGSKPAGRRHSGTGRRPRRPATLSFDIGGTGLKASVLDLEGKMLADRVKIATTYPCSPEQLVERLTTLAAPLPSYDRISAGFPGVVRDGAILTAPHFVTTEGPGSKIDPHLVEAWTGFHLASALEERLGKPVRVANDADLQGLDVVSGNGLELVVTLGTGVGTGVFVDGKLAPHLELAHHPFRKGETYNDQLGNAALKKVGPEKWRKRVKEAIANFKSLLEYDRLFLGGGNARVMQGHVDDETTIVDNVAGILGGIKLWDHDA